MACERAWANDEFCRAELGLPGALGQIDQDKLNVDGGAIALGHPVGASGTRIVLHVLNVLRRTNGKRGMAAICIGGGLGGAMLVETGLSPRMRVDERFRSNRCVWACWSMRRATCRWHSSRRIRSG